jgi:hypothetical protein
LDEVDGTTDLDPRRVLAAEGLVAEGEKNGFNHVEELPNKV